MLLNIDVKTMETVYLSNHIKRTVTGPMWHGPALDHVLGDVTAVHAAARPMPQAHTIWEIVLHVAAWAEIARARLRGEQLADPPAEVDWPAVTAAGESDWTAALERLRTAHTKLSEDVRRLDPEALHEKIGELGYSRSDLLHGVIEHGTYHGGQMILLAKAQGLYSNRP